MNQIEVLQKAFPGTDEGTLKEFLAHTREAVYPAGTVLCKEGSQEDVFYVIVDGQVEICKWIEMEEKERRLHYAQSGAYFGEMALIHSGIRLATVRATQETTVLELDREHFINIISQNPRMALALVRSSIQRLQENDRTQIDELRKMYQELQRLDQAKLNFIEVAAHELRTPLTVIQGYGKVLAMTLQQPPSMQDRKALTEVVNGLQEGLNRMLEIVNAMLDVSRIDSDALKVMPAPVLTKYIAHEAIHAFNHAIQERDLKIVEKMETKIPFIYADPALMNKLFYQLISNAIKYTPDGGTVTITTREVTDSHIEKGIEITIRDSGKGIPDDHLNYIFEKFFQGGNVGLHSSSKTSYQGGGPGLGLAIAQGIVEAHNGRIQVNNCTDSKGNPVGCEFHVLLPVGEPGEDGF